MVTSDAIIDGRVTWSSNGESIGYWVRRNESWYLGVNGSLRAAMGMPLPYVGGPVFGENQSLGYSARIANGVCSVINEVPDGVYDALGRIVFASFGKNYAYKAVQDGKEYLVLNGVTGRAFDLISNDVFGEVATLEDIPTFSADGATVTFVVGRERLQYVARNDELLGPYSGISGDPLFSNVRGNLVFTGIRQRNQEFLLCGEEEYGPYTQIWGSERQDYYSTRGQPYVDSLTHAIRFAARERENLVLGEIREKKADADL